MTDRHECNAYCTGTEHCDLVYVGSASSEHTRQQIRAAYWARLGVSVTRIEPAAEAAPLATIPPAQREQLGANGAEDQYRLLVWWAKLPFGEAGA